MVSLSQGRNLTLEGEETLEEEYVTSQLGPGRILVACAGNEGDDPDYVKKSADMDSVFVWLETASSSLATSLLADGDFKLQLRFYKNTDDEFCDTLKIASDSLKTGEHTFTFTPRLHNDRDSDEIYTIKTQAFTSKYAPEKYGINLFIMGKKTHQGIDAPIALDIFSDLGAEVECYSNHETGTSFGRLLDDADATHSVCSPGCIPSVICVGATAYRQGYYSTIYNEPVDDYRGNGGMCAIFSSMGPTFDGRIKPDVMAPGANILSAYSSYWLEKMEKTEDAVAKKGALYPITDITTVDGRRYPWGSKSGTSMSTPVVAGAIALWLQANPQLTSDDCKAIFAKTCRQPEDSLSYPNIEYGYGEIDVYAGLLEVLHLPTAIKDLSTSQPSALSFALQSGQLRIAGAAEDSPYTVRIYTVGGQQLYQQRFSGGEASISLSSMPSGVLAVQVDGPTKETTGSTLIRK